MNLTGQQTRGKSESETRPRGAKPTQQTTMPPSRTWLWLLGVLLANYFLARLLMPSPEAPITVPYTFFKEEVGKGNVEAIYSQGERVRLRVARDSRRTRKVRRRAPTPRQTPMPLSPRTA
jgi:cell division protease FtsH